MTGSHQEDADMKRITENEIYNNLITKGKLVFILFSSRWLCKNVIKEKIKSFIICRDFKMFNNPIYYKNMKSK